MSHVSVWDYHPEELADMVDGNEVRAYLFEGRYLRRGVCQNNPIVKEISP
jgi:hypothetical protein